jgi:hypothetical protein
VRDPRRVRPAAGLAALLAALLALPACAGAEPARAALRFRAPRIDGTLKVEKQVRDPAGSPSGRGFEVEAAVEAERWYARFEIEGESFGTAYGFPDRKRNPTDEEFIPTLASLLFAGGPRLLGKADAPVVVKEKRRRGPDSLRLDGFVGVRVTIFRLMNERALRGEKSGADVMDNRIWADPVAGLNAFWKPLERWGLRGIVEGEGFGGDSGRAWRATLQVVFRADDSTWVTVGWEERAADHRSASDGAFRLSTTEAGLFAGIEFWF